MKKNNQGLYRKTFSIGRKEDGSLKRIVVYGKTIAEVEAKTAEKKLQYGKLSDYENRNINVEQLVTIWKNNKLTGKSNAHIKRCETIIALHILPYIGIYKIKDVKPMLIESIMVEMKMQGKYNTAHKTLQIIKSVFQFAQDNGFIDLNPAKTVAFVKYVKEEKKPLTKYEQDIILNSTHKHADFFKVLLLTGMRRGEIAALTWNDIDFDNNTITISKACDYTSNQPELKAPKNGKTRIIPLLDKTKSILLERAKNKTSLYVFHKVNNEILSAVAIHKMHESFEKDTKLKFSLHQLRHTFCTMLFYSGISSKKAQLIMGHSNLSITLNIYTHLDEEREDNTANILNKFIQ